MTIEQLILRCRYEDCRQGYAIANEEEQVTCSDCREYFELPEIGRTETEKEQPERMRRFWDRVNAMLGKHDVDCDVLQEDKDGKKYTSKVSKMIVCGYLEIEARGVIYRSIPTGRLIIWVAWESYEIVQHFSALTDPDATVKWVSFRRETTDE